MVAQGYRASGFVQYGIMLNYGYIKGVIFLKPNLPNELFFFQETARDFLIDNGAIFNKEIKLENRIKNSLKTILPIARSSDQLLLSYGIETAKLEFAKPFSLQAKEIAIFEKLPGQWICRSILHKFDNNNLDEYDSFGKRNYSPTGS